MMVMPPQPKVRPPPGQWVQTCFWLPNYPGAMPTAPPPPEFFGVRPPPKKSGRSSSEDFASFFFRPNFENWTALILKFFKLPVRKVLLSNLSTMMWPKKNCRTPRRTRTTRRGSWVQPSQRDRLLLLRLLRQLVQQLVVELVLVQLLPFLKAYHHQLSLCCLHLVRRKQWLSSSSWSGCRMWALVKLQVPKLQEFHSLQALHICDFFFSNVIDRSIRYLIYTPARSSSAEGCFPCRAFRALTSTGAWAQPTPHWEEEEGQGSGPSWTQWSRSWPWTPWKPWIVETALDEQWRTWKKKTVLSAALPCELGAGSRRVFAWFIPVAGHGESCSSEEPT